MFLINIQNQSKGTGFFSFSIFVFQNTITFDHDCLMNECVKALGAEEISKSNPVVVAEKVAKI